MAGSSGRPRRVRGLGVTSVLDRRMSRIAAACRLILDRQAASPERVVGEMGKRPSKSRGLRGVGMVDETVRCPYCEHVGAYVLTACGAFGVGDYSSTLFACLECGKTFRVELLSCWPKRERR